MMFFSMSVGKNIKMAPKRVRAPPVILPPIRIPQPEFEAASSSTTTQTNTSQNTVAADSPVPPPSSPTTPVTECIVCTEELQEENRPACGHPVHLRCIALAGQQVCSVCRQPVTFTPELQQLFEQHQQANEAARVAREQSESIALARQLQRQELRGGRDEGEEDSPRRVRFRVGMNVYRVRLESPAGGEGAIDYMELMLQLNQFMHNINNRVIEFTADPRVMELWDLLQSVNRLSATTGLTATQVCSILENNAS